MCDRAKTSRAGSQVNFIEFVVAPIYAQVRYSQAPINDMSLAAAAPRSCLCTNSASRWWRPSTRRSVEPRRLSCWLPRPSTQRAQRPRPAEACKQARSTSGSQARRPVHPPSPSQQVYKIFPELGEAVDNLLANRHFWQDALLEEIGAGPPGAAAEERVRRAAPRFLNGRMLPGMPPHMPKIPPDACLWGAPRRPPLPTPLSLWLLPSYRPRPRSG